MERHQTYIDVAALIVTDGKAAFIANRDIEVQEVLEVLEMSPRFFVRRNTESGQEEFSMPGQTLLGRYLLVAIEEVDAEEHMWRLITAYPLNARRGKRLYEGG